ncbi:hypothetical protein XENORESO_021095 [Xenotaenia resolanae]|uniref:Uncharacterized protein n=1 Tax=Xenotaenia resolanae TaxID=208358 RepID=A0ABV0WNG9_9TELE
MGVNSPLTEHNGTRRHSGSLGDIVSSGLHSPCRRIERLHCTPPGRMDGGRFERVKGEERENSTYVYASVLEERDGSGGDLVRRWGWGCFCPMPMDLFFCKVKK